MLRQYRYVRNTGGRLMDELLLVYVTGNMHIYTVCPEYLHCSTCTKFAQHFK